MKYGFVLTPDSLQAAIDYAVETERAGWDGFFLPQPKSTRRVLRCDGVVPMVKPKGRKPRATTPDDVREIRAWIEARQEGTTPLDIVIEGVLPDDPIEAASTIAEWADAGATWWIESPWGQPLERRERSLRRGPPRGE
jgi:hypothetical protein